MTLSTNAYQPDIMGGDFEQQTLHFADDYEGAVVATLVRKRAGVKTNKAVLYLHGFIDYFFQSELAEQFNAQGYDFYALDLRKYGRSKLPHQSFYNVLDLREYDADIHAALDIIAQEQHKSVLLAGHSTGGLTATLFSVHHPTHPLIRGVWLNSPFYDFYMSTFEKKLGIPLLSALGDVLPNFQFPSSLSTCYVPSLHQDYYGEWNFNLQWKPLSLKTVSLSFVRAIHLAQAEIHAGVSMSVPTLIMHSHQSAKPKKWHKIATQSDVILNVKDMIKYGQKMQGDVQLCAIKNALHDVVLSAPEVREEAYLRLFNWIKQKLP